MVWGSIRLAWVVLGWFVMVNGLGGVHTITKKHYIPESTFNYQKALTKHMQGGVWMPCLLLFYVCWIIKVEIIGII